MKRTLLSMFKKHIGTRRKEWIMWLLTWSIGLIMTSIPSDNSVGIMGFWAFILLIPGVLLLITMISLLGPLSAKEREKEPLLIDLIRQPHNKIKWGALFLFFLLLGSVIIFKYVYHNPDINKFLVTALSAFIGVAIVELVNIRVKKTEKL